MPRPGTFKDHVHQAFVEAVENGQEAERLEDLLRASREENARLHRCITMAMGCLDPDSKNRDERLAWYRLFDAKAGLVEPRDCLPDDPPLRS